jgi:hypothetical protein
VGLVFLPNNSLDLDGVIVGPLLGLLAIKFQIYALMEP